MCVVSKQNVLLFNWIIWKQTDLSLASQFFGKYVGILLEITSIPRSPCYDETANLLLCSEYVGDNLQELGSASISDISIRSSLSLQVSCLSYLPFSEGTIGQLCCCSG